MSSETAAEIKVLQEEVLFLGARQQEIHKLRSELYAEEDQLMYRRTQLIAIIGDLAIQ